MLHTAFAALVDHGQHVILSSSRPLALQRAAGLLSRRLHDSAKVRLAEEAPVGQESLLEHFNRIVRDLSLSEATADERPTRDPAVLPVRVTAERPIASIALLAKLCRALPGADVRLLLIVEHGESLADCIAALGANAVHLEVTAEALAGVSGDTLAAQPVESSLSSSPPSPSVSNDAGDTANRSGWFSRIVDSATHRPLRFALFAIGIPGLIIALILAIGLARSSSSTSKPSDSKLNDNKLVPRAAAPSGSAAATSSAGQMVAGPIGAASSSAATQASAASGAPSANTAQGSNQAKTNASQTTVPPASGATAKPPATLTAPAQASQPATTAQSTATLDAAAMASFVCSVATTPPAQAQARSPSKDAGMVYLVSSKPMVVCVTDASGKTERHELVSEQGRSFFGKPPWQVQAQSMRDLQIFFQGSKITLPRGATDRVELTERPAGAN